MTGSQSAILSASQKLSPLVQGRKGLYSLSSSLQHNFWRGFVGAIKKFWAAAVSVAVVPFISVDLILKGAAAPLASEALLFIHI